ncbi:type IV secretory system conjugative DNA transfer family protein [Sphingomonas naphthae]|uniref:Type IV secretory system conjugative DNA transfer family protein n=1 Tax=Sphingomonas naphthae TaxID=1813468 RepID=A0ABY7TM83_9SPHN|nr:type IV secretory system conjugative DNA transfer family protein [Sphingomonas naphthae]WCT74284.1 type IV secretory system conjugative DNA transfer family protein [Sphingomonas naphthae]
MPMQSGSLDAPLLQLSPTDHFTLRDAVQGVVCMGGIGSGKTSASKALRQAYLRAGMGGMVLCAKPEERDLWLREAAEAGRSDSVILVDGNTPIVNFLVYELRRQGANGLNAVLECLMQVLDSSRAVSASPGKDGDAFWSDSKRQALRHTLPVLMAAKGTVSIPDIITFVRSAPRSPDEMTDPGWQKTSFFCAMFAQAAARLDDATGRKMVSYWKDEWASLDPKTRGNIAISVSTALDRFNHGWLQTAFCTESRVVPELAFGGAILILDMPALTRNEDGIVAQQLMKFLFQRAVLARNGLPLVYQERPVFLWADEFQYFVNAYDAEFLSTCRGSKACMVILTQSLPTLYAKMGSDSARDRVHHLLGNFATRIWHNQACHETNRWAADTIGQSLHRRANFSEGEGSSYSSGSNMGMGTNWGTNSSSGSSSSYSTSGNGQSSYGGGSNSSRGSSEGGNDNVGRNRGESSSANVSRGYSEQMGYLIEPAQFGRILKTGGPAHGNRVSAVWFQAGRRFNVSGGNAFVAEFRQ